MAGVDICETLRGDEKPAAEPEEARSAKRRAVATPAKPHKQERAPPAHNAVLRAFLPQPAQSLPPIRDAAAVDAYFAPFRRAPAPTPRAPARTPATASFNLGALLADVLD